MILFVFHISAGQPVLFCKYDESRHRIRYRPPCKPNRTGRSAGGAQKLLPGFLQNRKDYEKIFNFKKPGLEITEGADGNAGLDLDALINMFNFKKNRRMLAFQKGYWKMNRTNSLIIDSPITS